MHAALSSEKAAQATPKAAAAGADAGAADENEAPGCAPYARPPAARPRLVTRAASLRRDAEGKAGENGPTRPAMEGAGWPHRRMRARRTAPG